MRIKKILSLFPAYFDIIKNRKVGIDMEKAIKNKRWTKNKAFTLIELLAVIVILAIIALIATPIILNILSKVRKSAFQDTAYGILESGKLYYAGMLFNGEVTEQTFLFDGENRTTLEYTGEIPKGGVLQISASGEISLAIHNKEWCALKGKEEENIRMIKYKYGKCSIPDSANKPVIALNGESTIYLEINGTYKEEGAIARTSAGEELEYTTEIRRNEEVVNSVDTSIEATYKIIYTVTDETGNIVSVTRTVIVEIDTVTPSLTVENYEGKVGDDVLLSTKYTATFGEKGGNVVCKHGSTEISNVNYFKEAGTYSVNCIANGLNGKNSGVKTMTITLKKSQISLEELVKDNPDIMTNDPDGNPRFVGANPNNYVTFNGEAYRIIGIFNGQMKIIQNDFYNSANMQWASNNKNNWSTASLQNELNTTYWNSISATYQNMVDQSHVWNLGGWSTSEITRSQMYQYENEVTVNGSNPTTWTGKVALMYPSDYAYASNGGSTCDSTTLYNWDGAKAECADKSWLYNSSYHQWTLTPTSNNSNNVFCVFTSKHVSDYSANSGIRARPVLYLKSEVKIMGGTGTTSAPYTLGM